MSKKRKIISLAVLGVLLLASLALSLLLGKGGAKESLQTIMRDAVLHEDNKISLFGLMDVNPAVVSGFIVTGVLLVLAALAVITIALGCVILFGKFDSIMLLAGISLIVDGVFDLIVTFAFSKRIRTAREKLRMYANGPIIDSEKVDE